MAQIIDLVAYRAAKKRAERTQEALAAERAAMPPGYVLNEATCGFTDAELVDLRELFKKEW